MTRTELQQKCNELDCDLYRLLVRVERLAEENRRSRGELQTSAHDLRKARLGLRMNMHPQDVKETA